MPLVYGYNCFDRQCTGIQCNSFNAIATISNNEMSTNMHTHTHKLRMVQCAVKKLYIRVEQSFFERDEKTTVLYNFVSTFCDFSSFLFLHVWQSNWIILEHNKFHDWSTLFWVQMKIHLLKCSVCVLIWSRSILTLHRENKKQWSIHIQQL